MKVTCQYCGNVADFVNGEKIYPQRSDLHHKTFYLCESCDAYVGANEFTKEPLGVLANKTLRDAKIRAHSKFDPIWKKGYMAKSSAYRWLSEALGKQRDETHIGTFDVQTCLKVEELCIEFMRNYHNA